MGYRPGRWLFGLLPLALIGVAAHQINTQRMETSLERNAASALAGIGAEWATVDVEGRDARITGTAPDDQAAKAVADAVAGLYGIRRIDTAAVTVAPPPPPAPPDAPPAPPQLTGATGYPTSLTGTFDPGEVKSLTVTLAGRDYVLGTDPELKVEGDRWTLTLAQPLPDGTYDVKLTAADAAGNTSALEKPGALVVETPAPAAPTIDSRASNDPRAPITGTWTPQPGATLAVTAAGKTYTLGKDAALTSDAAGRWTLIPDPPLADGPNDVSATVTGAGGKTVSDAGGAKIVIDTVAPATPSAATFAPWTGAPDPIVLSGTYAGDDVARLSVSVAGRTFTAGDASSALTAANGQWKLSLKDALPDGAYTVTVQAEDAAGNTATSMTEVKIAPALVAVAPKISVLSGSRPEVALSGTVAPGTTDLTVTVGGSTFRTGEPNGPVLDTATGAWTLSLAAQLAPGNYDVVAEAKDGAGTVSRATTPLVVKDLDLTPPPAPAISSVTTNGGNVTVTGTWSPADTSRLQVKIGEDVYISGLSPELQALDTGSWTLTVPRPTADGNYPVFVTAFDAAGNPATVLAPAPILVDTRSPALPTVNPRAGTEPQPVITGTWPEGDAARFTVAIDGQTYVMGETPALQRTGPGQWSLTPTMGLAPGSYDVVATATDAAGNASTDVSRFEILVKPSAAAAPAGAAADCQQAFADLLAREEIRFASDSVALSPESDGLLKQLADAAEACPGVAVMVAGHTDDTGSDIYNRSLSEGRAAQVVKRLVKLGVDPGRLTAVGFGETQPLKPNDSPENRALNRRIEFKVQP